MRLYRIIIEDANADKEAFINKFGQDEFELFSRLKGRMANRGISSDITWHVKHTSKEEMKKLLADLDNRKVIEKNGTYHNNIGYRYSDDRWEIVEPLDWQTAMNLGDNTIWCITGRWHTNGVVKPSQAKDKFNEYLETDYETYYFITDKSTGKKYCYCPRHDGSYDLWTWNDDIIQSLKDFPKIDGFEDIVYEEFEIENGVLIGYNGDDTKVTIPNSVTILGNRCFYYCESLKSITIPNSVTSLGDDCFYGCTSLQSITIPNSVTSLGDWCFGDCLSLKSITIPNSVTSLGDECFAYCSSLQSVTIPNSVTILGDRCFYNCSSLKSITIPNSVTSLGDDCFYSCPSLQSIKLPQRFEKDLNKLNIPDDCEVELY